MSQCDTLLRKAEDLMAATAEAYKRWFEAWYFSVKNPSTGGSDAGFYPQIVNHFSTWPEQSDRGLIERGFLSSIYMRGGRTLELCCGDGYYTAHYFAPFSREVLALDWSAEAVRLAKRFHARDNVTYAEHDILAGLPDGPWDNVVWDGAIEYFEEGAARRIISQIAGKLDDNGILTGCIMSRCEDAVNDVNRGRLQFYARSEQHLRELLLNDFAHARVMNFTSNARPTRNIHYFACSQHPLPPLMQDMARPTIL